MKALPVKGFGRDITKLPLSSRKLRKLSPEQLITLCDHSQEELERLAIDAEVETIADSVRRQQRFLNKHPDIRNLEGIS